MSRQTLPEERPDYGSSPFFPSFQKEMNRLIDQFRSGFPFPDPSGEDGLSVHQMSVMPAIDVVEQDGAVEVSAEVPGVKEDDLEVMISGDTLILKGKKSSEHDQSGDNYHMIERRYGSFRRQIPLGFTPEDGKVEAEFKDGILKLRIEKPATAKSDVRKIDIKKS